MSNWTFTYTYSEACENHKGMEIIGKKAEKGFSIEELEGYQKIAKELGYKTQMYNLERGLFREFRDGTTKAKVLVIRNGLEMMLDGNSEKVKGFIEETKATETIGDKKAFMKGRVVNKRARWNLCFAEEYRAPNYENKKGTIVAFKDMPYLSQIRNNLGKLFGDKCANLFAEMNYYYDLDRSSIGMHGDSERSLVIGMRVGARLDLRYQWYFESQAIGDEIKIEMNGGDIYFMSERAVGQDWLKKKIPTLRHGVGPDKMFEIERFYL